MNLAHSKVGFGWVKLVENVLRKLVSTLNCWFFFSFKLMMTRITIKHALNGLGSITVVILTTTTNDNNNNNKLTIISLVAKIKSNNNINVILLIIGWLVIDV